MELVSCFKLWNLLMYYHRLGGLVTNIYSHKPEVQKSKNSMPEYKDTIVILGALPLCLCLKLTASK